MKLLFDQNISFRLVNLISDYYPNSKQVKELGLENSTDLEIFNYAKKNGFSIVTFDSDFFDLTIMKGFPPKIIWLRTGNTTTLTIKTILEDKFKIIQSFLEETDDYGILEID